MIFENHNQFLDFVLTIEVITVYDVLYLVMRLVRRFYITMKKFKSLKDHVYDYIAAQIREGVLLPDHRINENAICKELNISRTPVREALIQLSAEGILENQARRGFVIRSMTPEDVKENYAVIGILDGYAAKLACDNMTERDLADMSFYIETMDIAVNSGNYDMYFKQQRVFHHVYINKCGNSVLIDTLEKAKNKLLKRTYSEEECKTLRQIFLDTNNEHRQILKLFQEKDKEKLLLYLSEIHWSQDSANFDNVI